MTGEAQALLLAGAVGAMAFGAAMFFLVRRRDRVALWMAFFLAGVSASIVLGGNFPADRVSSMLATPFLALFAASLVPGAWQRPAAVAAVVLGLGAAAATLWLPGRFHGPALALAQWLALAVAAWTAVAALQLVPRRRSAWPVLIPLMGLGHSLLLLGLPHGEALAGHALAPAGFLAFVLAPGVVLARRAVRAFNAEEQRVLEQAKVTADVFDSLTIGLAMRDLKGRYLFVNRAWEKFVGARREDVIGKTVHQRAPKEEADAVLAEDHAALARGPNAPAELKDFSYRGRRFMLTRTVIANAKGTAFGVLVASIDTTERYAMEQALAAEQRRSLDQAKLTTDVLDSVPVALSMRDPQGKYLFVNRTWEKYYGASREQVIGTTPRARASEQETVTLLAMDKAALDAGPGSSLPPMDFGLKGRRYLQTRTAVADSQGRLIGVLIASIDTTERAAMEQALAAEQRRLALVVRAANVGILDWDGLTRTVYYSGRFKELLRYPPDSDTSAWPDFFDLVHPEDKDRVSQRFRAHVLAAGPEGAHELHEPIQYRLRRADGSYVWIEAVGASVRDAKGYVTRFIASFTDISDRRYHEEALRAGVRLREEVERMSRHDLKTPLNSMIAMARLLRADGKLPRKDEELLVSIERAGYRILNMVNLSLDLFRMEQGKYEFRPRPVDLATVVRRVAADLEGQAASKRVAVRLRAGGASTAYGEELLCYSMLANLIKNAIEAAPDDSAVEVTLEPRGEALLVHVHNAGAVPEEVRARFFQKYATSGKSAGLGLGTYSARLLARVQQGDITLRTSGEEGTTVTVQLALARQPEPQPEQPAMKKSFQQEISAGAQRVLVVDDDEFNRMVLRHCLPSPPFTVDLAVNGRAALEAARAAWPDAVFLDLEMPVMDGYEAAAKLRQLEREGERKRCIIVAISSNDEAAIIQRALQAGCDHYLVKPAPRETLLRILAGEAPEPPGGAAAPEAAPDDPVELDPDLEASLPAFFASRRKALDEMPVNLAADDRVRFKRLAHKLAGSFTMYGFRWAAAQCRALERDAGGAAGELARRAAAVRAHLDTVKVSLRAEEPR